MFVCSWSTGKLPVWVAHNASYTNHTHDTWQLHPIYTGQSISPQRSCRNWIKDHPIDNW